MVFLLGFKSLLSALYIYCLVEVLDSQGTDKLEALLNKTDLQVQEIAKQAVLNHQNTCDSLPKCTQSTCVRHSCRPQGKNEIQSLTCSSVNSNPGCSSSCRDLLTSTEKPYIRLSPLAAENNIELQKSICAQKSLDKKLQEPWRTTNNKAFFGGAEGFLYVFPGRDYLDTSCTEYDQRRRPWYINAFAVVKSLYLIMDTSPSMSNTVSVISKSTCLDAAKGILMELLNTLTNGDQVGISSMDGEPIGTSVSVSLQGIETAYDQTEIISLKDAIKKVRVDNSQGDLKKALSNGLQFFKQDTDLRVLLILTDGGLAGNLNLTDLRTTFTQLNQEKVVIFVYRIGYDASNDATLLSLNMTFSIINDDANPLWNIRSYSDYVAWLRFVNVQKRPVWVPLHVDSSGLVNVTTCTFPAFDANQRLIGIAGVDVEVNKLISELGLSEVQQAVTRRSAIPSHQPLFVVPSPVVNETLDCPPSQLNPICLRQDFTTPMSEYVCCGKNCTSSGTVTKPAKSTRSGKSLGIIVGISAGGTLVLTLCMICILWLRRGKRYGGKPEQVWHDPKDDKLQANSDNGEASSSHPSPSPLLAR